MSDDEFMFEVRAELVGGRDPDGNAWVQVDGVVEMLVSVAAQVVSDSPEASQVVAKVADALESATGSDRQVTPVRGRYRNRWPNWLGGSRPRWSRKDGTVSATPSRIAHQAREPIEVNVYSNPTRVVVGRGLMKIEYWKLCIPWWQRRRIWHVPAFRLEYPKNERQLRRAIEWAEVAARHLEAQEAESEALVSRIAHQEDGR